MNNTIRFSQFSLVNKVLSFPSFVRRTKEILGKVKFKGKKSNLVKNV